MLALLLCQVAAFEVYPPPRPRKISKAPPLSTLSPKPNESHALPLQGWNRLFQACQQCNVQPLQSCGWPLGSPNGVHKHHKGLKSYFGTSGLLDLILSALGRMQVVATLLPCWGPPILLASQGLTFSFPQQTEQATRFPSKTLLPFFLSGFPC